MTKELALVIVSVILTGLTTLFVTGVVIPFLSSSRVDVEYTMHSAPQLMPIIAQFLPSEGLFEFIQRRDLEDKQNKKYVDRIPYDVEKLIREKNTINTVKKIGSFIYATILKITNSTGTTASNVTIISKSGPKLIGDLENEYFQISSIPGFTDLPGKKNIGDLSPGESRQYLILSGDVPCQSKFGWSPTYQVVHDKGFAFFDEFVDTNPLVNLALRYQGLSYIFICVGLSAVVVLLYKLLDKLVRLVSIALSATAPSAEGERNAKP
jgi:hypothetical protein